ncbi:MAG: hypothetical protein QXL86_00460 [Candidatus Aenigmatarchaeota archaeon]
MGVRGFIRDIVGIYLGFEIIKGAITKHFEITIPIIACGLILLGFGIWFILERVGIIPKL